MSEEKNNKEGGAENTDDTNSIDEIAEALDVDDPEEIKQLIAKFSSFTSSPVPPTKVLKGYDEVVDGGAKWLMDYTKAEQMHRHSMDKKELNYYSVGQAFGFILGLTGIG